MASSSPPARRPPLASLLTIGLIVGLTLLGTWIVLSRNAARPSVVVITIDTLRADALGAYGAKIATPHIDHLAATGIVFDNAASPLPETRPAHFTLFTSRYPRDHGVMSNALTLGDDAVTLAEIYAAAGYATGAFVGCVLLDPTSGAAQGFQTFDAPREPQRPADQVVPKALAWLAGLERDQPFFLWLHLFDPHMPYEPPPPYDQVAASSPPETMAALPRFTWPRLLELAEANGGDLPEPAFRRALDLYAGEVAHVDHWIGQLFAELLRLGRFPNTAILLTADHGECFSNGIFFEHSHCLYDGAVKIPMILRWPPRLPPGRTAAQVELLDIGPTLLELSRLDRPASFRGQGLLARRISPPVVPQRAFLQHPFYRTTDIADRRAVVARLRSVAGMPTRPVQGDRLEAGVRTATWKYLLHGDQEELYDLANDPGETRDLAATSPDARHELRRALRAWLAAYPQQIRDPQAVDPELLESLRALGYL